MLRKLFRCLPQCKKHHAPSSSSLRSPAALQVQKPRDGPDTEDTWAAWLPNVLFLEILLRLEPAAVVCCAGVCKPWRRAIIDNASILGPHLDRFFGPSLLLGIFHCHVEAACAWILERTPGLFQSALPSNGGGGGGSLTPANSLVPAAASAALPTVLSSKDGFILLPARRNINNLLCLCNPVTGYCAMIPASAGWYTKYVLLSAGAAGSSPSEPPAVWILAVHRRSIVISLDNGTLAYQTFSTSGGGDKAWAWGPVVQSSGGVPAGLCVWTDDRSTVVCKDAVVYWPAGSETAVTCVFALDVRTGRTWTTELPPRQWQQHLHAPHGEAFSSILATFGDGRRLSLVRSLPGPSIVQVWVLSTDDNTGAQWTLHRTIPVDVSVSRRPTGGGGYFLSAFCQRSRCVVAMWSDLRDQELLIDIENSRIRRIGKGSHIMSCPYEIDSSSTYISKMKHF